ncbi:MAG: hypothetical protein PHF37_01510 [Phycisphaerae bacterium]|nr:hypothetical protein [Phycisphaerae bacterium]
MKELLFGLQQQTAYFPAVVLLIPGIILLICGLISWLAGIWGRSWIAGILAAAIALWLTPCFSPQKYALAAMAAIILFVFAFFLYRGFFALFSAALVAATAIIFLAADFRYEIYIPMLKAEPLTVDQSLNVVKEYSHYWWLYMRAFCNALTIKHLAVGGGAGIVILLIGARFNKLAIAFGCAAVGAIGMSAAMILLLMFKNSSPLDMIYSNALVYLSIFAAMIAFGTLEQFLLFSYKPKKKVEKDEEEQGDQQ